TDQTAKLLEEYQSEDTAVRVITHNRNRGYGAALKSGIRSARSDLIVITDADGTYPNHRIPELVTHAAQSDMIVGARIADDVQYSRVRKFAKIFLKYYAVWIAGQDITELTWGMGVL